MSDDAMAVTRDGVRLPYGRFLSDSASGYVLLLTAGYVAATHAGFSGNLPPLPGGATPGLLILAGVFVLLLGPACGLALNAASWFSLGWIEVLFLNSWARVGWFHRVVNKVTYSTGAEYSVAMLKRAFRFLDPSAGDDHDLYSQVHLLQNVLQARFPAACRRVEYLNGIKIFIRNLSLLTLAAAFILPLGKDATLRSELGGLALALGATLVLTLLACFLELYRALEVSYSAFGICLAAGPEHVQRHLVKPVGMGMAHCIETLLRAAPARRVPASTPAPAE